MTQYVELQQKTPILRKMEHDFSPQMSPLLPNIETRMAPISELEIERLEKLIPPDIITDSPLEKDVLKDLENIQNPAEGQLIDDLERFAKNMGRQILPFRQEMDVKEFIMVFTLLKGCSVLPEQIYTEFKSDFNNTVLFKDFSDHDLIRAKIKKSNRIIERNCIFCLKSQLQELASEFLGMTIYVALEDNLIKQAINYKAFDFLDYLLKKTKRNFNQSANTTTRHASQHSRHSIVESFKTMVQNQISFRSGDESRTRDPNESVIKNKGDKKLKIKKKDFEIIAEMIEVNKLLMTVIESKREKTARKLLYHYYLKFLKDFLSPKTLYLALENELFLFFKKYFDIFPFSKFNISDFSVISKALIMLEGRDTFIHAIFTLSKINAITLSEIHVRSIIEHLENIWKEKLYFFTYTLNPILLAVLVCELCHKLSRIFANVKVRLGLLAKNYLSLAVLVKNQIHDEQFIKTIYIYRFYPSKLSLLQILYKKRSFYAPLLQSDLIAELVSQLWYCDYYNTYNIFNTSSAFQNLKGNLIILENINSLQMDPSSAASAAAYSPTLMKKNSLSSNKVNPVSPELVSAAQINPALIDENALKLKALQSIDLRNNPFHFIRKSNFFDFKFTNHIFSFFFWQKSPAYRVIIEAVIYMIFFILILQNCFELFRLRRVFEGFPTSILILIDAMVGLSRGVSPPDELWPIIYPWMSAHNTTDPRVPLYVASQQKTFCAVMVMFVPSFESECDYFDESCNQFWSSAYTFVILQSFFFFTMFGTYLELIYGYILHKKFQINFKIFSDVVISFTSLYVMIIYYTRIYFNVLIIRQNMLENYIIVEEVMLVFTFLMWIKFFVYLKLTKTFGYVIKVIEIMIWDLLNFMVIFTIILIAFSLILYDLLSQSQSMFVSFEETVQTLLLFTYGQVSYDNFSQNETLGSILISIFSFISIIILLNLLVAILNNTYRTIFDRSNLENANIFYLNYLMRKPDKYKSALISFAPPLNLYVFPFIPLLLLKKSSRLNSWICLVGFTMFFVVYVSVYLGLSLAIVIPLCWIKYIFSIYVNVIQRSGKLESYVLLTYWTFGGLFYLIYLLFTHDIVMFVKSVYRKSPYKDRLDEITMEEIKLIKKICLHLQVNKKYVTHHEFCNAIREELTELNKTARKYQMTENWDINMDNHTNFSNKLLKNSFLKAFSDQKVISLMGGKKTNLEKQMKQNIELDKMEVFSLIKQYTGVNGNIMLNRMVILLDMLKFCKKFHLVKNDKVKVWKLVNCAQIVDILAVERAVLGILSSNLKSQEQYELVVKTAESSGEKNEIALGEENKIVKSSKSFMNQMLKKSLSLKKKATEYEIEERKNADEGEKKTQEVITERKLLINNN